MATEISAPDHYETDPDHCMALTGLLQEYDDPDMRHVIMGVYCARRYETPEELCDVVRRKVRICGPILSQLLENYTGPDMRSIILNVCGQCSYETRRELYDKIMGAIRASGKPTHAPPKGPLKRARSSRNSAW